jgi:predicted RNase H-like HicB family nuclease
VKKFLVVFEKTRSGYSTFVPDLPGCVATGQTKSIAEQNIYEAIQMHLEGLAREHIKLPRVPAESEVLVF